MSDIAMYIRWQAHQLRTVVPRQPEALEALTEKVAGADAAS
ncbi:hypothetical protein MA6G0728R_5360 [Mycobacteroides abscessus 6G-0728-R]|nr:hypothetical protein MA6G0125S_5402 [Mycobacteroides abscessus 6G-0125-S]EIU64215.1 hypothetical protein MA6G0728S_5332 [Mycobacteroides abscessus 6G-0728-S]EIU74757.1 hypothetical protein MA6G1108_5405 [Mycobacteroides abscessus 6G-1108]EIV03080.1 hypothetical protein MA6G0728R_5360 [Mycobacteroides abscessus 6G-0728-R]